MKVELISIDKLIPYARNPRLTAHAVDKVAASIKEFGFRQPIVVDGEMVIIAGHVRHLAAQKLGLKKVPVHIADNMTPTQVKAYRIADNRTGEDAQWDNALLALEIGELDEAEFDNMVLGFEPSELEQLHRGVAGYMDMNIHTLPWPSDYLKENGTVKVWLRVTLSYFIEPNPAERLPTQKYSYASHRLKFELQRPLETPDILRQRVNKKDRPEGVKFESVDTTNKWQLGANSRNKGSIVSDVWVGTAAELADQNTLVIIPEGGWWKYRKHLKRGDQKTRYSLIVSLETENQELDIYTKIKNLIAVPTAITT